MAAISAMVAESAFGHFLRHHLELLAALVRKTGGGIAHHQLGNALGMGQRESERHRAAETVADQHGVIGDAEFLEAVLDRGHIGVHQRQQSRLRAVEAGQVEQRDAMLGGKRRQHRIEGVAVGEQRMQHHDVGAFAGAHRGQRAMAGGQLFHRHQILRGA